MPIIATPSPPAWVLRAPCSLRPCQAALACFGPPLFGVVIAAVWWRSSGVAWFAVFALLQVLAMAAAFVAYSRHAGDRDTVRVQDGQIDIEQLRGTAVARLSLPAAWARVEGGGERPVRLEAAGQSVQVGRMLNGAERRRFARELAGALRQARSGG